MIERGERSVKAYCAIGLGGFTLALATAAPEYLGPFIQKQNVGQNINEQDIFSKGVVVKNTPDCKVSFINNEITCYASVSKKCLDWGKTLLINEELNIRNKLEDCATIRVLYEREWK